MEHGDGGEFACCGVYQPRFTSALIRADITLDLKVKRILIRLIKEIGYGARGLMKLHAEINSPERVKTFRQPLIKEFLKKREDRPRGDEGARDEPVLEGLKKGNKRRTYHSKYSNPDSEESEDDSAAIRNPPTPEVIFARHINVRNREGSGGVVYWEWKAG
jgi:hypothetical protein